MGKGAKPALRGHYAQSYSIELISVRHTHAVYNPVVINYFHSFTIIHYSFHKNEKTCTHWKISNGLSHYAFYPPLKSDTGSAYFMDNEFGLHALFMYVSINIISSLQSQHTTHQRIVWYRILLLRYLEKAIIIFLASVNKYSILRHSFGKSNVCI